MGGLGLLMGGGFVSVCVICVFVLLCDLRKFLVMSCVYVLMMVLCVICSDVVSSCVDGSVLLGWMLLWCIVLCSVCVSWWFRLLVV